MAAEHTPEKPMRSRRRRRQRQRSRFSEISSAPVVKGLLPGGQMLLLALLLAASPSQTKPLTADEIVARHVEARGGAAKLKAIRSLRLEGKIVFGGGEGAVTADASQLMKRPDSIRREFSLQGLTGIDGFDGKESWSADPFGGRRDAFRTSADDARALSVDADFEGPLVDAQAKGHKVEYLGTEDVDGTPALKLRV